MLFIEDDLNEWEIKNLRKKIPSEEDSSSIWTLEFDGSFSSLVSSAGVVSIPPKGVPEPMSFKLGFGNKNNIVEHEAPLLGIIAT